MTEQPVTVLGAGVAGLAVALALARRGVAVRVIEQAAAFGAVGAGVQISPNGARVLQGLGLGTALAAASVRAEAVEVRNSAGGRLVRLEVGRATGGYHFLHRAALVGMLATAAATAGVPVRFGAQVLRLAPWRLDLAGGEGLSTGLVIGADGVHSLVRAALNGDGRAAFSGQVAWRAVIDDAVGAAPVAQVFAGPGRHLVSYPLPGGLRNIVAVEERAGWVADGWSQRDDPAAVRAAFAGFGGPVPGWLARVEQVHLWGLFAHPVVPVWHGQGMVLAGDAAHPMLPFLAQGANMALEDAWVLADHLAQGADLALYQRARAGRVARVMAAAAGNARAYHLRGPLRRLAHLGLRLGATVAPGLALRRFDWLYGADVTGAEDR